MWTWAKSYIANIVVDHSDGHESDQLGATLIMVSLYVSELGLCILKHGIHTYVFYTYSNVNACV